MGVKIRSDAKPIDIEEAKALYRSGLSLRKVAQRYDIDHANLIQRFKKYGVPLRSKSEAMKGQNKQAKGDKAWNWKGGYSIDCSGYVVNNRTKVRLHREIISNMLGRPLTNDEVVHHIDGNKKNNDLSNLMICTNTEHLKIHAKMCNGLIGQNHRRI